MGRISRVLTAGSGEIKSDPGGGANLTHFIFNNPGMDSLPLPDDLVFISSHRVTGEYTVTGCYDTKNSSQATPGDTILYARNSSGVITCQIKILNTGDIIISNDNITLTIGNSGSTTLNGSDGVTITTGSASLDLSSDGTVVVDNGAASVEVAPSGTITANTATIDPAGNITTSGVITAGSFAGGSLAVTGAISGGGMSASGGTVTASNLSATSILANGIEVAGHTHTVPSGGGTSGPMQ